MRPSHQHRLVNVLERSQQTSLLCILPSSASPKWQRQRQRPPPRQRQQQRCNATHSPAAPVMAKEGWATQASYLPSSPAPLALPSTARRNEIGVQQVSSHIHSQLFPASPNQDTTTLDPQLVSLSKEHLRRHDLLGKQSAPVPPVAFDMPPLHGATLDEHFYRLAMDSAEPYLTLAKHYAYASPPPRPRQWQQRSGWTKYHPDGSSEPLPAPDAHVLTFDTEVMWTETNFPAMACAVSATHWYAWISPWLLGETEDDRQLIPLGDPRAARIVVGHNIGYDRARIAEEYSLDQSRNFFLDTMSLHVAVNGMCSRQRPTWVKHRKAREVRDDVARADENADLSALLQARSGAGGMMEEEEELWVGRSSVNSLRDVAKFHCGIAIDKTRREWFGELDRAGIVERLQELLDYCAADVDVTHKVYRKVFPLFLETCPHPVSFAALRHLSTQILPLNKQGWEAYLGNAEATYHKLSSDVEARLAKLAEGALEHRAQPEVYTADPWLRQLDWSGQEIRMVKGKKKNDPPRPAAGQKKPGMPKWYKDLFPTKDADLALTVRTRIVPLLLRLAWEGHPLVWSDKHGWTFAVARADAAKYRDQALTECDDMVEDGTTHLLQHNDDVLFKLPHRDGAAARCASPLAKGYRQFFENGVLGSEYEFAREALEMNASCSYWISARDRIISQMVVYDEEKSAVTASDKDAPILGYILPQVIPMGTITRRAVENTWLTASNAKRNRVGSELKSMITAPPGYSFVGADVDSQELWIAALVGDVSFGLHGGNALGFMTLEGSKAAGTDLHSRTAKILGISRDDAKVFNYGRIYGAGVKFAQSLLRRFNPSLREEEAAEIARKLYTETKGKRQLRRALRTRSFWAGGTESLVFNGLEDFAEQEAPRTPVLGAGITEALMRRFLGKGGFLPSRINWAIQSSGVDYLHLLIVSMDFLTRQYGIDARLALTVHDEIRYLARDEDKYRCALALQVANVWTRAMFSEQMGVRDLPQSCAFFSAVDVDRVLRKEVDMDCVTPSHPNPIPNGESLDIAQLLALGRERAGLVSSGAHSAKNKRNVQLPIPRLERFEYTPRKPVMQGLRGEETNGRIYLRAQMAANPAELNQIVKELRPAPQQAARKDSLEEDSVLQQDDGIPRARRSSPKSKPRVHTPAQRRVQVLDLLPVDVPWAERWTPRVVGKGGKGSQLRNKKMSDPVEESTTGEKNEDEIMLKKKRQQWGSTALDLGLINEMPPTPTPVVASTG